MINEERLANLFDQLVRIDSVSKEEGEIAAYLKDIFAAMKAEVFVDHAGEKVGGQTGNLVAKFKGNVQAEPLLLAAHMDTVEPGRGVVPVFESGVFTSKGETILGADDKSAIAVILEILHVLQEKNLPHGPLDVVMTICEEIGLLGAKHLDFDLISARYGYTVDATDTEGIVTKAPSANHIEFKVHGKAAHAGAKPENGINAILVASKAISGMEIGRIDRETTCNIGVIQGGLATNIVPDLVTVKGEARSHSEEKLQTVSDKMVAAFESAVSNFQSETDDASLPFLECTVEREFTRTDIPESHPVIQLAQKAAKGLGRNLVCKITGGGADANVFCLHGIDTGVLGTGMREMHTTQESVALEDMVKTAELLIEIIQRHAREKIQ
ncbi:MAG: M20/M25/M40 family metallo-hydrolase [Deltaproteobacteria bacterium]|jgi:tripeptide aminopeptidase